MPTAPRRHPGRRFSRPAVAAIDLGTSNCRMMVAVAAPDGFRVVDSLSRIVALGEGLPASGLLSGAAMDRAVDALASCAERFRAAGVVATDAVATEACRRAANAPAFLARVRSETGLVVRTISAREEARLTVESCGPLLRGSGRRALLFDIGGGSTELAWLRLAPDGAAEMIGTVSLPFGVVTAESAVGADAAKPDGFARLAATVDAALAPFEAVHRIRDEMRAGGVRLVGTSGTVTTLAGEALRLPRYRRALIDGAVLSIGGADGIDASLARLRALGPDGLVRHPCVGPERARLVLAGCAIFAAIRRRWPATEVLVADRGLREGLLLRLLGERERRWERGRAHARPPGRPLSPHPPSGPASRSGATPLDAPRATSPF